MAGHIYRQPPFPHVGGRAPLEPRRFTPPEPPLPPPCSFVDLYRILDAWPRTYTPVVAHPTVPDIFTPPPPQPPPWMQPMARQMGIVSMIWLPHLIRKHSTGDAPPPPPPPPGAPGNRVQLAKYIQPMRVVGLEGVKVI